MPKNDNLPKKENMETPDGEMYEATIYTLTDEEGKENDFELIASAQVEETMYLALEPANDNPDGEYVILKVAKDEQTGEEMLVTIDDDDEFDKVADLFEDEFMTLDYDDVEDGNGKNEKTE